LRDVGIQLVNVFVTPYCVFGFQANHTFSIVEEETQRRSRQPGRSGEEFGLGHFEFGTSKSAGTDKGAMKKSLQI